MTMFEPDGTSEAETALKVKDLIALLQAEDPDAPVYVGTNCHGCFQPAATLRRDERGMVVLEDAE